MRTIGYLIPEFPGQTHIFFWREMNALKELGIEVEVVSTRRPPASIISHTWSAEAIGQTIYLFPMRARAFLTAITGLLQAGPIGWWRCLSEAARTKAAVGYRLKMLGFILAGANLAAIARQRGWRHVHVHSCANAAAVAMFARLLSGLPYSLTLHGEIGIYGPAQDAKWGHAEFGMAVTGRLREELVRHVGVPACKVDVAAMGVDLAVFQRRVPYLAARSAQVCRVASCGRLHRGKGHQDLIRAVAMLRVAGMPVELTVLGEGPARDELERLVAELGLAGHVRLRGAVSEQVVRDVLENTCVFALGSHDEAIGVATMEAMAMELPVVVTDVGGVRELVRDGIDGLLVPPQNPGAMAAALRRLIDNGEWGRRLGQSGSRRVKDLFGSYVSAKALARRLGAQGLECHQAIVAMV